MSITSENVRKALDICDSIVTEPTQIRPFDRVELVRSESPDGQVRTATFTTGRYLAECLDVRIGVELLLRDGEEGLAGRIRELLASGGKATDAI